MKKNIKSANPLKKSFVLKILVISIFAFTLINGIIFYQNAFVKEHDASAQSPNFSLKLGIPIPDKATTDAGVPLCPTHDVNTWHALYDPVRNCHYDHEHKDNPNRVNNIFGPVGTYTNGQSISYPWQTWAGLDMNLHAEHGIMENEIKHSGYQWLVRTTSDAKPITDKAGNVLVKDTKCYTDQTDFCITDFRTQVHFVPSNVDAKVRFHSYWIEARGCQISDQSKCGIIRTGGVVDFGRLSVDEKYVALPQDQNELYNEAGYTLTGRDGQYLNGRRVHGYEKTRTYAGDTVWYSDAFNAAPSLLGPVWMKIDPNNPSNNSASLFYCKDPKKCKKNNGSRLSAEVITVSGTAAKLKYIDGTAKDTDGKKDGIVSFVGHVDRFGKVVECSVLGADCVPLIVEHLPLGRYQYRDTQHGLGNNGLMDYDTAPIDQYWIQYPYTITQ